MRSLRVVLWFSAVVLVLFLVVSPLFAGIQETASQVQQRTAIKSAKLGEAQGGSEALQGGGVDFPEGEAVASILEHRRGLLITAGGLLVIAVGNAFWQRRKSRQAAELRRRPPSTVKAAPASHRDMHAPHYQRACEGPSAPRLTINDDELIELAAINSVGLLAGLAEKASPALRPTSPSAPPTSPPTSRPAPVSRPFVARVVVTQTPNPPIPGRSTTAGRPPDAGRAPQPPVQRPVQPPNQPMRPMPPTVGPARPPARR